MSQALEAILTERLVAVVRSKDPDKLLAVAEALGEGGIRVLEITFTVPRAVEVIAHLRARLDSSMVVGAGTVLDAETARAAILAGAQFVVSPVVDEATIRLCRRESVPILPGAFTPTEVLRAWEMGADIVKIFPAEVGGPNLLKALRGPFPRIRLMPTGGVDLNTARSFLDAGACALGLGSSLVSAKWIAENRLDTIRDNAAQFVRLVSEYVPG